MSLTVKKIEKFLNGTPKVIANAFFGGILPVSLLYHAYQFTGFAPFYWLLAWPKPLLDLALPDGVHVAGLEFDNEFAATVVNYAFFSCLFLWLLLREEQDCGRRPTLR